MDHTTEFPEGLCALVDDTIIDRIADEKGIDPEEVTDDQIEEYIEDVKGDSDMEREYE